MAIAGAGVEAILVLPHTGMLPHRDYITSYDIDSQKSPSTGYSTHPQSILFPVPLYERGLHNGFMDRSYSGSKNFEGLIDKGSYRVLALSQIWRC